MSISYSYEVIAVDEQARCMEILYKSEGHPDQHIGARLPFEGESLEDVIAMFAPVAYWSSLKSPVVVPQVGLSGTTSAAVSELTEEEIQNRAMWEQLAFERRVAQVLVKFGVLDQDPTALGVTQL